MTRIVPHEDNVLSAECIEALHELLSQPRRLWNRQAVARAVETLVNGVAESTPAPRNEEHLLLFLLPYEQTLKLGDIDVGAGTGCCP